MTTAGSKFQLQSASRFTTSAIVTSSLYGFILIVPVLLSILAVTAFRFGLVTFLIPLGAMALATFFLPLGFGNPYIVRLVQQLRPIAASDQDVYVVQVSREPRIRSGLMAILEDADDVGILSYTDSCLEFNGDALQLRVPFGDIQEAKQQNAGSRALFAYGPATVVRISDLPEAGTLRFAERSSWILPTSRRNANRMYRRLRERLESAGAKPFST